MIAAAAAGAATATTFPFVSSFHHRPRLRPSPRRAGSVLLPRATGSSSSSWEEREEARWLREEQRWQREEQRWLREESRWRAERDALLAEVAALRLRLRALEGTHPHLAAAVDAVASPVPPAAVPAPQPRPALVEEVEVEVRKEVVVVEEKKASAAAAKPEAGSGGKSRRTLRAGAEGEDVRAMQEALQKLGFYSGEEDMEYSSFSSGTDQAVKTWQTTVGTSEDGVMTSELLERLFSGKTGEDGKNKDGTNGAAVPAVTGIAEVRQTVVTENGVASGVGVSEHRVFLLGENSGSGSHYPVTALPRGSTMASPRSVAVLMFVCLLLLTEGEAATFTFMNRCSDTVWPGVLSNAGSPRLEPTGFELAPGAARAVPAPSGWSGRMWARTGCTQDGATGRLVCATGDCGSGTGECAGAGAASPATLAEFARPEYCCSGAFASPAACRPTAYSQVFKTACPRSYSYAFDDPTSTFTCGGRPDYTCQEMLASNKKPVSTGTAASTKTCISCRGEGRLMCLECDGTGEPNIEPQFLEWVGEDTKCPYCEGLGSILCDVCGGKKVVAS